MQRYLSSSRKARLTAKACLSITLTIATIFVLAIQLGISPQFSKRLSRHSNLRTHGAIHSQVFGRKLALCLQGGLRNFEITSPGILRHVLGSYNDVDIFIASGLDENSWKIVLWKDIVQIKSVRIAADLFMREAVHGGHGLLDPAVSQRSMQSLRLQDSCLQQIQYFEDKFKFQYEWAMWVRPDSYWSGPSPLVSSLSESAITIPSGFDYGGYNDRFIIGARNPMFIAMSRLPALADISVSTTQRNFNLEEILFFTLSLKGVKVQRTDVPFCILKSQSDPWSIWTPEPLNGKYCLPCRPSLEEQGENIWKCRDKTLPQDWQLMVAKSRGAVDLSASLAILGFNFSQCVQSLQQVEKSVAAWNGNSPQILCLLRTLGKPKVLGEGLQSFPTFTRQLGNGSVAYSFGYGGDYGWEFELLLSAPGLKLWTFGAQDRPIDELISRFAAKAGWNDAQAAEKAQTIRARWTRMPYMLLPRAMEELNHDSVDLVKMFHVGLDHPWLPDPEFWPSAPICQVILAYGHHSHGDQTLPFDIGRSMDSIDFELVKGLWEDDGLLAKAVFLSRKSCVPAANTVSLSELKLVDDRWG